MAETGSLTLPESGYLAKPEGIVYIKFGFIIHDFQEILGGMRA
jgi:hypothetical protein